MSSPTSRTTAVAAGSVLALGLVTSLLLDRFATLPLIQGDEQQLRAYPLLTIAISAANGLKLVGAVMVAMCVRDHYRDRPGARTTGVGLAVVGGAVFIAFASLSLSGVWVTANPDSQLLIATFIQLLTTVAGTLAAAGVMLVLTHEREVDAERHSVWREIPGSADRDRRDDPGTPEGPLPTR